MPPVMKSCVIIVCVTTQKMNGAAGGSRVRDTLLVTLGRARSRSGRGAGATKEAVSDEIMCDCLNVLSHKR